MSVQEVKWILAKAIWIRQGFAIYQNSENAEYQPDYIVDRLLELKEIF